MGYLEDNGWEAVGRVQHGSKYETAVNEFLKSTAMCVQKDYDTVKEAYTAAAGFNRACARIMRISKRNGSECCRVVVSRRGSTIRLIKED